MEIALLSQMAYLRRSFPLSFIPLPPSNLRPFGAPPSKGGSVHASPFPWKGLPSVARRGWLPFLRRSPLLFAFPVWKRGPRSDALVYDALETIFSLSFIPPVPYPPLRDTFPSRGRLCVRDSGALVNDALEPIFFALFHPARTLSAPPSWHLPHAGKALCRGQRHSHKCRTCILRK